MWVDGLPALCTSTNCDFTYEERDPVIDGYILSGSSLSITGTNLPTSPASVEMGYVNCVIVSNDAA